jgi:hypothetical protein
VGAHGLLASVTYDVVLCLCFADVWLRFAGAVAVGVARLAGAEDRDVAVAASKVFAFFEDAALLETFGEI